MSGTDDDKCGFGQPPRRSRFKPGQSGNPKGRRKGSRNLRTDVTTLMNKLVTVHHDGKLRRVSLQEAMLLRMIEKSVGGDIKASSQVLGLLTKLGLHNAAPPEPASATEDDRAIIERFLRRQLPPASEQDPSKPDVSTPDQQPIPDHSTS